MPDKLERLRLHVTTTVQHATDLLADLDSLDEALQLVMPTLADMTNGERATFVARLCGYDEALTLRLHDLVESLADVLAGLTSTDDGRAWLQHHLARLDAGEDVAGAA